MSYLGFRTIRRFFGAKKFQRQLEGKRALRCTMVPLHIHLSFHLKAKFIIYHKISGSGCIQSFNIQTVLCFSNEVKQRYEFKAATLLLQTPPQCK